MEVLFHSLHDTLYFLGSTRISMMMIWRLLVAVDKYQVEQADRYVMRPLKKWFSSWFEVKNEPAQYTMDKEFERQVMYPCYIFDYAEGFLDVSNSGI